jgi:hypothetical protein
MRQVSVVGGNTQIERVLEHAIAEANQSARWFLSATQWRKKPTACASSPPNSAP